jgi:sugar phosphate isomerase/epimerase
MVLPLRTLPRSYKKRYPFRIGTTSFIYPAGYTENVARLGPHVDEIEILMFESHPDSRPTRQLVRDLAAQAEALSLTYNIHLPTDLELTHPDPSRRHNACRILREFIASLMPLEPSVYVLHLPPPDGIRTAEHLHRWHRIAAESLRDILSVGLPGRCLALENLFFPYNQLDPLIEAFDLSVCLDTGHLALQAGDLEAFLKKYGPRIAIGHLHGLGDGQDHCALSGLADHYLTLLKHWLEGFHGSVSLEVFAFEPLLESLTYLEQLMAPGGASIPSGAR